MSTPTSPGQRRPQAAGCGQRCAGDRGSVSLFLLLSAFAVFLAVGLVIDGGQKLRATQRADDDAAEAARAGLQSVQPASVVRGQPPRVNNLAAILAGQHYLAAAGITGTVAVNGDRIQVTTTISFTPAFLSVIGVGEQQVTGRADARLARGVDQEQR
jgi:hypothetical protein